MPKFKNVILTIDIGSNAMRATFYRENPRNYQVLLEKRYPLRLGEEVFTTGSVSKEKIYLLECAFLELWLHCYKIGVNTVLAVGTSALRESKNAKLIIKRIKRLTDINIKLIPGSLEAQIIFEAVANVLNLKKKNILHIDIGGGSTEVIVATNGKIQKVTSLPLGTVRLLLSDNLQRMQHIVQSVLRKSLPQKNTIIYDAMIGTGGNFKTILKVKNTLFSKSKKFEATYVEVKSTYETLIQLDYYQRIKHYDLKSDRADVIIPALCIVLSIMKKYNIKKLIVSDVGLEEGLLHYHLPH